MFNIRQWWRKRILRRALIDKTLWQRTVTRIPLLHKYDQTELDELHELASLLIHNKRFEGAQGLIVDDEMRVVIAAQACIPILNLGIDWYEGWYSVIVYPAGFRPKRTVVDEAGVMHEQADAMEGEAWHRGPVILSWQDTATAGQIDGHNLVIHEFAHKLDMLNGAANGFPPLHANMSIKAWTDAFSKAYEDFQYKIAHHHPTTLNRYGASAPAEFFAVLSEVFFELPHHVHAEYPEVFSQLCDFYRQQPRMMR